MLLALRSNKMLVNTGIPIIKRAWTRFGLVMPGRKMLPYLMTIPPAMHPDTSFQTYDISSGKLKLLPLSFPAPARHNKFILRIWSGDVNLMLRSLRPSDKNVHRLGPSDEQLNCGIWKSWMLAMFLEQEVWIYICVLIDCWFFFYPLISPGKGL